jgi:UDP-glucose-4-epimerase GalE
MQETILVLGGAGYIGSHTAHLLAQKNYNVIIIDNFIHNQPFDHSWATIIRGDYGDADLLGRIFATYGVTAVMHFAGFISVSESINKPALYYKNNVAKTITVLDVMLEHAVDTIIFSSSAAVYGAPQQIPITEDHPTLPINPYGRTKLIIEQLLYDYAHAYNLRFVALRYFNAAGASAEYNLAEFHNPETHIIPLAVHAVLNNRPISVFGTGYQTCDGSCVRDFLHVADIAQAHVLALNYMQNNGKPTSINLGTGTGYSVLEIMSMVGNLLGKKPIISIKPPRQGDPAILIADPTKAQMILHWHAQHSSLKTIISSVYQAELQVLKDSLIQKQPAMKA